MAIMAVFQLLTKKISEGEIDDVRRCLPEEIRNIWPEPYKEPGRSATDCEALAFLRPGDTLVVRKLDRLAR